MTATPTFLPGSVQWLGLAKETVPGTAEAVPTAWIPVDSPSWSPKITPLVDQALRGVMATDIGQAQGMRHDELSYKTYIYSDSVFLHLIAALGTPDTVTGSADPVTHATSLLNTSDATHNAQPPSYTGFLYEADGKVVQIPGMKIGDLKFTFKADTLPTIDVMWMGLPGTFITAPVNTPSTVQPMPPFTASITVGGVLLGDASDLSIDIKRNATPIAVMNGTQSPLAIDSGPLTVSGAIGAVYQGTTDSRLTGLLTNAQPALSVSIYTQGDTTHPFTLQMSKIAYDSSDPAGSNNGIMTIASNFKAIANGTDALDSKLSPIKATIVNAVITPF